MSSSKPDVSIILLVDQQRDRAARCLRSLLEQSVPVSIEVLLLDFGHGTHPELAGSTHPCVRTFPVNRAIGYGGAMALGVTHARSPVVAFVEEHVVVQPDWAQRLREAYQTHDWVALCSEFSVDNRGIGCANLVDLFAFGPWSSPAQGGPASRLRWGNSTFRRDVLLSYRAQLPLLFNADSALYECLARDGFTVGIAPKARARHANEVRVRDFFRGAYLSNRLSVAARAEYRHFTWAQRLLRVVSALPGPFRSTRRLLAAARNATHRPDLYPLARQNLAIVFAHYLLVTAGAIAGLLAGAGNAEQGYLDYVLNLERGLPEDVPVGALGSR